MPLPDSESDTQFIYSSERTLDTDTAHVQSVCSHSGRRDNLQLPRVPEKKDNDRGRQRIVCESLGEGGAQQNYEHGNGARYEPASS